MKKGVDKRIDDLFSQKFLKGKLLKIGAFQLIPIQMGVGTF